MHRGPKLPAGETEGLTRLAPRAQLARTALLCCLLPLLSGCVINVIRLRTEKPIPKAKYDALSVGETRLDDALESLGAPTRVEWKSGDDYMWYHYGDDVDVGMSFRIPTPIPGYQHNFLRLSDASEHLNAVQLVFDEEGVLRYKRLRLARSRDSTRDAGSGWRLHLTPRIAYSAMLIGDGGVEDYADIFDNGFRAGLDLGFQPYPVITLLLGGSYQRHEGQDQDIGAARVDFGDLELADAHLGVRLQVPFSFFGAFFNDFEEVKRIVFEDDLSRPGGLRFYVQGTVGGAYHSDVDLKVDGVSSGNFYDEGFVLTSTAETGIEYGWTRGTAYLGLTYQTLDEFDEGTSSLDSDNSGLQTILVTAGVSLRF